MENIMQRLILGFRYSRKLFIVYLLGDLFFIGAVVALLFEKFFILALCVASIYASLLIVLYVRGRREREYARYMDMQSLVQSSGRCVRGKEIPPMVIWYETDEPKEY
jgi:Flp pilus assembly protein TadB